MQRLCNVTHSATRPSTSCMEEVDSNNAVTSVPTTHKLFQLLQTRSIAKVRHNKMQRSSAPRMNDRAAVCRYVGGAFFFFLKKNYHGNHSSRSLSPYCCLHSRCCISCLVQHSAPVLTEMSAGCTRLNAAAAVSVKSAHTSTQPKLFLLECALVAGFPLAPLFLNDPLHRVHRVSVSDVTAILSRKRRMGESQSCHVYLILSDCKKDPNYNN